MGLIANIYVVEKWLPPKENRFDFIHDILTHSQTQINKLMPETWNLMQT